jgi:competence protein ComEA
MRKLNLGSWLIVVMVISNFFLFPADRGVAQTAAIGSGSGVMAPINVNQASVEELQSVRGIGPSLADKIVAYRDANGTFQSLDDLTEVRGIGEAKLARIRHQIAL